MTDRWMERLSEYLDGELPPAERREMEQHLFACAECAAALEDLRGVVDRARGLGAVPLERDLWPGIAARIGAASSPPVVDLAARRALRGRRLSFSVPQLAAAALALSLVSGGVVMILRRGLEPGGPKVAQGPAAVAPGSTGRTIQPSPGTGGARTVGFAEPQYDAAVSDLERALREGRDRLDPGTVQVLEKNLETIDRAIAEARRALAADPASVYLNDHLARTMRRKLEILRQANAIAAART